MEAKDIYPLANKSPTVSRSAERAVIPGKASRPCCRLVEANLSSYIHFPKASSLCIAILTSKLPDVPHGTCRKPLRSK